MANKDLVSLADKLNDLMQTHSSKEIKENTIDRIHQIGVITAIIDASTNLYEAKINGDVFQLYANSYLTLGVKDIVVVTSFNGDINKRWISDKKLF